MPIFLDPSESFCAVSLQGETNIGCAAELKSVLIQALACGKQIRLDLSGATQLDITALQLLWACEHQAQASGKEFRLAGEVPHAVAAEAVQAGFEKFPVS